MARLERMKAKLLEWSVRWLGLPGDWNNVDIVEGHAVDRGGVGMSSDEDQAEPQVGGYSEQRC